MANPRIMFPIVGAFLAAAGVMGFLWWQLPSGTANVAQKIGDNLPLLNPISTDGQASSIDSRDEALLRLRKGDLLASRGQWSDAEVEYRKAVDADGGLPALRKLAQAQMQKRDMRGARETADKMKDAGARDEDLLLLEVIISLRTGELQNAQQLLGAASDSPQKSYGLALLAIVQGDHQTAQTQLNAVIGGWEPVLRSYARAIMAGYDEYALFPQSPAIHLTALLGRALAQVQECELALPLLSQVTNAQGDYRDAWIVEGYCELTTERFQEALASLERAYQIDPEKPETQYFLARAYSALKDHNNAITFLQYALQNGFEPKREVRQSLAAEAVEAGNIPLAIEQYDALTSASDATLDDYSHFVTVSLAANQKEAAYLKALSAAQKWTADPSAQTLLAKAALATGRKDEAKVAVENALQLDPSSAEAQEVQREL